MRLVAVFVAVFCCANCAAAESIKDAMRAIKFGFHEENDSGYVHLNLFVPAEAIPKINARSRAIDIRRFEEKKRNASCENSRLVKSLEAPLISIPMEPGPDGFRYNEGERLPDAKDRSFGYLVCLKTRSGAYLEVSRHRNACIKKGCGPLNGEKTYRLFHDVSIECVGEMFVRVRTRFSRFVSEYERVDILFEEGAKAKLDCSAATPKASIGKNSLTPGNEVVSDVLGPPPPELQEGSATLCAYDGKKALAGAVLVSFHKCPLPRE